MHKLNGLMLSQLTNYVEQWNILWVVGTEEREETSVECRYEFVGMFLDASDLLIGCHNTGERSRNILRVFGREQLAAVQRSQVDSPRIRLFHIDIFTIDLLFAMTLLLLLGKNANIALSAILIISTHRFKLNVIPKVFSTPKGEPS